MAPPPRPPYNIGVQYTYRDKLPTAIYKDNYGYAINYYQPMIDYIDKKRQSGTPQPLPHLPLEDERCLTQYSVRKSIPAYSESDLSVLSKEAQETAKKQLLDFRSDLPRSHFSVIKTADAVRLAKHLKSDTVEDRKLQRDIENRRIARQQEREEHYKMMRALNRYDNDKDAMMSKSLKTAIKGKSALQIRDILLADAQKNLRQSEVNEVSYKQQIHTACKSGRAMSECRCSNLEWEDDVRLEKCMEDKQMSHSLDLVKRDLRTFTSKTEEFLHDASKQTSIEIEQLNARVVEAETKLKTEVQRIKKKMQIHICELEMSLDVANKTNIDLQKTIKKQSLQLTEIQAHYDEVQRSLQATMDQYGIAQRRLQTMSGELEEVRGNYEQALRSKRQVELSYEESQTRITELTNININLVSIRTKLEQEITVLASDYEEINRELRVSDERYQKVQVELKHSVEHLHEEQERIVKLESIKKSLEIEVKNLAVRLEEVELNAVAGSKRIISKLESRLRDLELECDEEKRKHSETIKILRKKERTVKEVLIQCEEDQKNINILQETLEKATHKINAYKRQLADQEGMSAQAVTRVRRFQRELESAEDRAECAESNLNMIRTKHRTFVTTSTVPGSQVYMVQESRTISD